MNDDHPEIKAVEPEVFPSLDAVDSYPPHGDQGHRPVGCTVGPGCGCLGLPLAVLAGVVLSSLVALLWVLSLGRVPASILRLARQARRGVGRS